MKQGTWVLGLGLLSIHTFLSAEAAPSDNISSNALSQGLMLAAFVAIFYFFILRPQAKRAKEHRNLVSQLSIGDEVMTSGGIAGKVQRIADDFLILNIAQGADIVIQKQAIASVLPKGTLSKI